MSVDGSEKLLELVDRLRDQGRTVVFISHNLDEVFEVADRIAVLWDGQLVDVLENDGSIERQAVVGLMTGAIQSLDDGDGPAEAAAESPGGSPEESSAAGAE